MESMTAVAAPPMPPVEANENTEYTTHTEDTGVAVEEETCTPCVAQNDEEAKAEQKENTAGSNVENGEQKEEEETEAAAAAEQQQEEVAAAAVNEEAVSTPEQKLSPASPLVHLNSVVPPPAAPIHVASPDRLHRRKVNGSLMSDPTTNTGDIHKDNTNGVSNTNAKRHGVAAARSSAAALRRSQGSNHKPSTTDKSTTHATAAAVEVDAEGVPVAPATTSQLPSATTTHTVTQHTEQTTATAVPQHEDNNDVAAHKAKHLSTTTGQKKAHATHHTTKKPTSNAAASSSSLPSSQLKHTPTTTTTTDTQRKSGGTNTTPLCSRRRHLVPTHPTSLSTRGAAHQKTDRPTSYETSNSLSHTTQMSDEAYMQDMMKKYHGPATTTLTRRPAVGRKVHKQPRTEPQEKTETSINAAHNNNEKTIHHTAKKTSEPTRRSCQRRLRFDDDGLCALRQQLQRLLGPVRPAATLATNQSNGRHTTTKSASRTRVRNASPTMQQDEATQSALAALPFNTMSEAADAVPALPRALEMSLVTLYEEALTQLTPSVRDQLVLRLSPPASRAIVLDCVKRRLARLQPTPLRRYNSSLPGAMSERSVNGGRKATSMPGSPYARRAGAPASAPREERSGIYDESALTAEAVTRPSEPLLGGYRQPSRCSQRRHLRPNTTTETITTASGPLEEFRTAFATEVRAMFIEDCALACLRAHQRHERRQNTTTQPTQKEEANESQQRDNNNEDDEQREAALRECYSRAVQAYLHRLLGTQAGQSETSYVEGLVTMLYPWLNSETSAQAEEVTTTQDQDNTHTGMVDYFILLVTEGDAEERSELPVTECGGEGQQTTSEDVTQGESNELNALEPEVSAPAQPVLVQ